MLSGLIKITLGMSLFKVVLGKPYHVSIELEHQTIWAIKTLNLDLEIVGVERKL